MWTVPHAASPRMACPCTVNPQWSIQWVELEDLTFIAKGGFGNVYSALWRDIEVGGPYVVALAFKLVTHHFAALLPLVCAGGSEGSPASASIPVHRHITP